MKKLLSLSIIAVIVATFSIFTYSCSAETDEIENKVITLESQKDINEEYADLQQSLTVLTNQALNNAGIHQSRASFWKHVRNWAYIIACDALGFCKPKPTLEERLYNSICCSYKAAQKVGYIKHDIDLPIIQMSVNSTDEVLLANESWASTTLDRAGLMHNKVLVALYNKHGNELLTVPSMQIYSEADSIMQNGLGIVLIPNDVKEEAEALYAEILDIYESTETIEDFFDEWRALYPAQTNNINILETVIQGMLQLDLKEDNGVYLNNVVQTINSSYLSEENKQTLRSAISIGHASAFLWEKDAFSI